MGLVNVERLAEGLVSPEGPAVLDDGSVAFVETNASRISIWSPDGDVRVLADTGGGPNACCVGSDGALYVAQNRGIVRHVACREDPARLHSAGDSWTERSRSS